MNLSSEQVILLIKLLIIVALIWTLVKYSIKVFIAVIAILIIFQIGFMMTGTDLENKFKVSKYLNNGYNTAVIGFFDDFRERGNRIAIVNQEEVYNSMVDGIEKGSNFVIESLSAVDIDSIADTLARNIYKTGSEVIDVDALTEALNKQLENVNPEDTKRIINLTMEKVESIVDNSGN